MLNAIFFCHFGPGNVEILSVLEDTEDELGCRIKRIAAGGGCHLGCHSEWSREMPLGCSEMTGEASGFDARLKALTESMTRIEDSVWESRQGLDKSLREYVMDKFRSGVETRLL